MQPAKATPLHNAPRGKEEAMVLRRVFFVVLAVCFMSAAAVSANEPVEILPAQEVAPGVWMAQMIAPEKSGPCVPDQWTLCFHNGRFNVAVAVDWTDENKLFWATVQNRLTDVAGTFWFYSPDNTEMVLKVLDGCWLNGRFWVFMAGLTDQPILVVIWDMTTGWYSTYATVGGYPLIWRDTEIGFPCSP